MFRLKLTPLLGDGNTPSIVVEQLNMMSLKLTPLLGDGNPIDTPNMINIVSLKLTPLLGDGNMRSHYLNKI